MTINLLNDRRLAVQRPKFGSCRSRVDIGGHRFTNRRSKLECRSWLMSTSQFGVRDPQFEYRNSQILSHISHVKSFVPNLDVRVCQAIHSASWLPRNVRSQRY